MNLPNVAQYGLFLVVVTLLVKPLGGYMARVFTGQKTGLDPLCGPVERMIYRLAGIDATQEAERSDNPALTPNVATGQPMGNMDGKEVRFGIGGSVLTAVTTSNTATGSTNSMHDSYTPLGGAVPLVNMLLGEMIFGGLGTGIYSIIVIALLGLFVTGLMIGRTPEYLGKKIEPSEMKLLMIYTLMGPVGILALTALAVTTGPGLAGLTTNSGPHGFTEILYAYTSSFANNGQSFAGLSANSPF
jgi:potassium-transporting ATPase potassium-binding subunit